ncbi:hypothetical protein KD050_10430 [Psychrobacillus sp. INOP01]|uniref:hypothetical protein n=1 Tax=Psychrobacillus sp. INOP01 TaxID=2829187 RepID=UPI001BABAFE2|nr:hypothetical protein [Psychrobacillus sp. INOP01]QUG43599.1 hypothetical protein KD050_10430 [Psychrobacillus sp. INOP01]
MTIGTKEDYLEKFKYVLMTNYIGSSSTSLDLMLEAFEREIANITDMREQDKTMYTLNLQKAFKQIKSEISGVTED